MPQKNSIKTYVDGGFYHIYNRGVEKRVIFEDDKDYKVFLNYIKESLIVPPNLKFFSKTVTFKGASFKGVPRLPKNFNQRIDLLAYVLMPNHFHFLIKQKDSSAMESFMRSLITRYSMYFNKRYSRVGKLFQGHYKAVMVLEDKYLLHLSRYIHLNPLENIKNLDQAYSSYAEYLGIRKTDWVNRKIISSYLENANKNHFRRVQSYKDFVEKYVENDSVVLGKLTLE